MAFHLEEQIAENLAAGMGADETRYAALRSFGNPAAMLPARRAVSIDPMEALRTE